VGRPFDLSRFARVPLGNWPTPLEECPRLSEALGGPRVLVKRDDVNGLGAGGNKLRKLEFLLGAAIAQGADTVVTFGGVQTNHGRQTAAACARLGLACELVLTRSVPRDGEAYDRSGNVALDLLYGARVHVCDDQVSTATTYNRVVREAAAAGRTVATLPIGGSNELGVLGYLAAAVELRDQLGSATVDRIICPAGSCGTAAGLALGVALLDWPVIIDAAAVSGPVEDKIEDIRRLVNEAAELLREPPPDLDRVRVTGRALGPGYGVPTEQVWEAIRLFGRTEGITLDPVYTGKAAAALVDAVRCGEIGADQTVVFMHTGGMPGLFGYGPELYEAAIRA
jgi:D-cysteine desulfhydrase family pyridoxal phosphate-dependent enzyme